MIPVAYYNEHDPRAAATLAELIARGHIAFGIVDTRSIEDVTPNDLRGFTQCHFFAGIGVWSYALRRAGWDDDRPIWTGSCPCQPFSAAGEGRGFDDERHLWPAWFQLIAQCRPHDVLGEQVASKDGLAWLDLVHADMEAAAYAGGFVDLCAAGVGAPHIRQRLFFGYGLADAGGVRLIGGERPRADAGASSGATAGVRHERLRDEPLASSGGAGVLADHSASGLSVREREAVLGTGRWREGRAVEQRGGASGGLADTDNDQRGLGRGTGGESSTGLQAWAVADGRGVSCSVDDADGRRLERSGPQPEHGQPVEASAADRPGPTNGHWRVADWLLCRDGKWRPVEPNTFPLAHGAPERVGRLRGYGNAIVAQAAQAFIESYIECLNQHP